MSRKFLASLALRLSVAAMVLLAACSSASSKIKVDLTSYKLGTSSTNARSGNVTFTIKNQASDATHEMLIVKTDLAPDQLPMLNAAKVNEEALNIVGSMEDIPAGQGGDLTVNLPPGNYVLICDVDGHYTLGMHAAFTVAP